MLPKQAVNTIRLWGR